MTQKSELSQSACPGCGAIGPADEPCKDCVPPVSRSAMSADLFLWPDDFASEDGTLGWVSRDEIPDAGVAILAAARELCEPAGTLRATPVLMREESEVEAKINGHEFAYTVECTKRARSARRYWRVTRG